MSPSPVIVTHEYDGAVCRIRLNTPEANVLDTHMMSAIETQVEVLGNAPDCKLLLLCSEGQHFSYGASIQEHTRERAPAMLRQFHGLFGKLINLSLPMLAVVRGKCLGGGFELACFCHFVIADAPPLARHEPYARVVFDPAVGMHHDAVQLQLVLPDADLPRSIVALRHRLPCVPHERAAPFSEVLARKPQDVGSLHQDTRPAQLELRRRRRIPLKWRNGYRK